MELKPLIGDIPASGAGWKLRARIHQGWWRAFVLKQKPGSHPSRKESTICNTLPDDTTGNGNFLSEDIARLAARTAEEHRTSRESSGIMEENRLRKNLLSSQPLCFNFFGPLSLDPALGLKVVQAFFPEVTGFSRVRFEFAPYPAADYTQDRSAFDVALEVSIGDRRGLIGIECKYTDTFSPEEHSSERYREIYGKCGQFTAGYDALVSSRFNQLFRNQLIAESLLLAGDYDFVNTVLFCSPDDEEAKQTGAAFAAMTRRGLTVIDHFQFIEAMQKLDLGKPAREYSMLLWARYLATELSDEAAREYRG